MTRQVMPLVEASVRSQGVDQGTKPPTGLGKHKYPRPDPLRLDLEPAQVGKVKGLLDMDIRKGSSNMRHSCKIPHYNISPTSPRIPKERNSMRNIHHT